MRLRSHSEALSPPPTHIHKTSQMFHPGKLPKRSSKFRAEKKNNGFSLGFCLGWGRPDHPGQVGTGLPWTSGAGATIPEGDCFQFFPRGQPGGAVAGVTGRPWVAKGPASSHASASPSVSASVSRQVVHPLTGVLSPSYTPASPGEL